MQLRTINFTIPLLKKKKKGKKKVMDPAQERMGTAALSNSWEYFSDPRNVTQQERALQIFSSGQQGPITVTLV